MLSCESQVENHLPQVTNEQMQPIVDGSLLTPEEGVRQTRRWRQRIGERRMATPAPGLLEEYSQRFDGLFTKVNRREGFRQYLTGLLLESEQNKTLTGLANQ
jgi:hypothetical protein